MDARTAQWLADAVLLLHAAIALFVVSGPLFILLGNRRGWRWVYGWPFRAAHLAAIAFVVLQAWLGQTCPLTTLEMALRAQARQSAYAGGFIEHWVGRLLFYRAPTWVFTLAYSAFGALVALLWWRYPPRRA